MKKRTWSIALFALAFLSYFFPAWNGIFFDASQEITLGDGRIQAAIFVVGGLLLWYQEEKK